jgi:hypothetical protein
LIQLEKTTDKIEIMKNKLKLRNLKEKKMYINEKWSREEREIADNKNGSKGRRNEGKDGTEN